MTEGTWRERVSFYSLQVIMKGSHGRNPKKELVGRNHGEVLLTGLLSAACSACLIEPRAKCPVVEAFTVACACPLSSSVNKMPAGQSYRGIPSTEVPFSEVILAYAK